MIYVIMGRSGSGKSSVEREVSKIRQDLKRIISDTTRPIREGEVDGVDYHFITEYQFATDITLGSYIEHTVYNNWFYGINKSRIDVDKFDYICVTNPMGYKQLKAIYGDIVIGIVIHSDDKARLLNYLNREKNPDCKECCRRFLADCSDFESIEQEDTVYHVFNKMGSLQTTIKTIIDIINKESAKNAKCDRRVQ